MSIITHSLRSKTKKNALCEDHVRHSIRLSVGLSLVSEPLIEFSLNSIYDFITKRFAGHMSFVKILAVTFILQIYVYVKCIGTRNFHYFDRLRRNSYKEIQRHAVP
jgi:hypothetical protein